MPKPEGQPPAHPTADQKWTSRGVEYSFDGDYWVDTEADWEWDSVLKSWSATNWHVIYERPREDQPTVGYLPREPLVKRIGIGRRR